MTRSATAKRLNLQEVRVSMGIFDFDVICIIGSYKSAKKYCAWKFETSEGEFAQLADELDQGYVPRGKCFRRDGYVSIVWMEHKPKTSREIATFAHECGHAIFDLFGWAGIPITRDTEEVFMHSQAHLVTNFLKDLR